MYASHVTSCYNQMLSQNSKSQKSIGKTDLQRLEKSKSRGQNLEKTPSAAIYNPYVEQLGDRSTSKKRKDPPAPYNPPILLDQNKQLLSENRQMAVLILEKNATIDAMQAKLNERIENEISMFREVEAEKKRLIQEILQHKQATDQQISAFAHEVSTLQEEKASLERHFQQQLKKQELAVQQERKKEVDQLRLQHQQALTLLKAENVKLKEESERKGNQTQIKDLQSRQKLTEALSKCESLSDELRHLQQVRRLEQAEQKMLFQGRIQKLHLDYRREKEIFLLEHDSQIKRLQDEVKRLRKMVQEAETAKEDLKEVVQAEQVQRDDYQEKVHYEAEASIALIKQVSITERNKLESLLKTEITLLENSNQQEQAHLSSENKRLTEVVAIKQREIEQLMREIDELRQARMMQLQNNQKLVRELQSKLLTSLLEGETESEALKVKLARLREADLTGLRQYYEHQIQLLSRGIQEKENALAAAREKHHQQLRHKIEMRKGFDLEVLRFKSHLIELQNEVDSLKALLKQQEKQEQQQADTSTQQAEREAGSRAKLEQLRNDECRHLQAIITAKDAEIEGLTHRLELLKQLHAGEREGWQCELQAEKEQLDLAKSERAKMSESYEAEISKLKEMMRKEREQFGRDLQLLKEEHRADFDAVVLQLAGQRERNEEERQGLLSQLKKKELEIEKLNLLLASREKDILTLQNTAQEQKLNDFTRERQQLQSFYNDKLKQRENEAADLKQRIDELSSDLRDARENYNDLERRMEQLIEAQSELREFERRVMQLGKDNNLTKNLQQVAQ